MLDTFNRFHHVGKFCNFPRLTSHGNNFEAVVMIQMDVLGRNNYLLKIVLEIGNFVEQVFPMMVIDERYRPGYIIAFLPLFLYEFLPDEVPECLRPVRVVTLSDIAIKLIEKCLVEGNTETK
jgi:hypothetical protein